MRKNLKRLLSLVMTLSIVMSMLNVSVSAAEEGTVTSDPTYEATDSYVLNYANTDIEGYEEWSKNRFYFSPYRTDIYVDEGEAELSNWNWCTASVLNMINTTKIDGREADTPYASIPVYCVDAVTDGVGGYDYRRVNLEDATHFDDTVAGRVRAIIINSFPHIQDMDVITDEVNDWIEENYAIDNDPETEGVQWDTWEWKWTDADGEEHTASYEKVESLNFYEVISATQSVIWTITNNGQLADDVYAGYNGYIGRYSKEWHIAQCIYSDITDYTETENTRNNINAVARYLESLEPMDPQTPVISEAAFGETEVVFTPNEKGTYTAKITTKVTATLYGDTDLTLTAVYGDKKADGNKAGDSTTVKDGENTYELTIENLPAPGTIYLAIDGVQTASDVFLFDPVNGRDTSQSMAGFDTSTLPVHAEASVTQEDEDDLVNIKVTKVWADHDDQDGVRPNEVTVILKANGEYVEDANGENVKDANGEYVKDANGENVKVKVLTLNKSNDWSGAFENLDETDENGVIVYTIEEADVGGYQAEITLEVGQDGSYDFTLTNCHTPETINISGTKTWSDADNQDGKRPGSITIRLLADGDEVDSQTVGEDDDWEWSFNSKPKYRDQGVEIVYTITEDAVDGYAAEVNGYNVTNAHTPETIDISGSKTWEDDNDHDGLRPESITINLLANGEKVDSQTVSADAEGNWKWEFTGLAKYADGEEIAYTFIDEVDGYTADPGTKDNNYVVTNTHENEQVTITTKKEWKDEENRDGKRPQSVQVQLYIDDIASGDPVTLNAGNKWTYEWKDLDKYHSGGTEIKYSVKEVNVPDGYEDSVDGYVITNTYETTKISINGKKTWEDKNNQDGVRPKSITINLLADGKKIDSKTVTPDANGEWKWTFDNQYKYRDGGVEIKYTITENAVDGYTSEVSGYDVTNTHETETTSISGKKTWNDANDQDGKRPESITINLFANGEKVQSKTVTAADGWKWTFENVDKYAGGKEITYTITEDAVAGYTTTVNGYNVTNSYAPGKTSVSVTKAWNDDGNRDGIRPASVTVQLLANGTAKGEAVTLSAENGWTYTWSNLDEKSGGKTVTYTVEEISVPEGYTVSVSGNASTGYTVTNTHESAKTSVDVEKVWKNTSNPPEVNVVVKLLADGEEVKTLTLNKDNGWKGTFSDLPVNQNGKAITYTVEEVKVSGYSTAITGSAAEGFTVTNTKKSSGSDTTPASWSLTAKKTLNGQSADGYTFELLEDGKVLQTKTSQNGKIVFDEITYAEKEATYTYTVREVAGSDANIVYDASVYTVVVKVVKDGSSYLASASITLNGEKVDEVLFENKTTDQPDDGGDSDSASYTLTADKTLDGKKATGFTFEVKDESGAVVATASAKSGKITFPAFRFTAEGTYTYTVSEAVGTNSSVVYDDSVYTLTITVTKNGGDLVAACTGLMKDGQAVEAITFENTYDGERFYDDDEEELFEEDIPLGGLDAPETGDAGALWTMTAAASGLGLIGLNFFPKKRKEDDEE